MKSFQRTVFELDIYGEVYKLKKPTGIIKQKYLSDMDQIQQKIANKEELNGDEDYLITANLLDDLGLPKKVFDEMEDEHQIDLVNYIFGAEKN